jgi:hypothetical protein
MTMETILALPIYMKVILGLIAIALAWLLARGIFFVLRMTFSFLATLAISAGLLYLAYRLLLMFG